MSRVWRHDRSSALPGSDEAEGWWFRESVLRLPQARPGLRVIVVAAPPGSGRARLVRSWLSRQPRVAWTWVSLRGAAEERLLEDVVEPAVRGHAAQDLAGLVVLDGAESLGPAGLERVVDLVLAAERRPQLVLVGRGEVLPAALAVRLAGQLAEVRGDDLWWPVDVVQSQLAALSGIRVDAARVERIHRHSGGWPAGVLALGRSRGVPLPRVSPDDPTAELAVDDELARLAADLVLDELPSDLRDFVLRTSVVPGITQDLGLCEALVPGGNPALLLEEARRWGLTNEHWPGRSQEALPRNDYHPFVLAAARQVAVLQGDRPSDAFRRAGEAASGAGQGRLAVDCFLVARAWPQVLAELERAAPQGFRDWKAAQLHTVLSALPAGSWEPDDSHRALVALAAAGCGDHLLAAQVLGGDRPASWWATAVVVIRSFAGRIGPLPASADALPAFFGMRDHESVSAVLNVLSARAALFEGDQLAVTRHLSAAWKMGADRLPSYVLLIGLGVEALAAAWAGELSAAQRLAERATRLAAQAGLTDSALANLVDLARAEVLRARGEPEQGLRCLAQSSDGPAQFVVNQDGGAVLAQAHRVLRSRLLLDLGDLPQARAELERLRADGDDHLPAALRVRLALARARLAELDGDHAAAQACLDAAPTVPATAAVRLGLALQRQDGNQVSEVLENWPTGTGLEDRLRRILGEAAAALAAGRRAQASEILNEALVTAEPDGQIRVFLDGPAPLRVLASTMLRRSPEASPWRRALIARLDQAGAQPDDGVGVTRRELVVLEKLTGELTHAQIAAELFVSENTLKSHCRNLYRKLGVHSREEAVRIARVRGWLNSSPREHVVVDVNITRTHDVVDVAEL
ncbi:LuxR C-terminal-related transcriptional regulator [Kineosporia sp. NBRC 101677]|uniref:LuxR C-terminal-related transcriptional regulator n=1 Tax=Kineosporia sp. NBRC 101677 TaxID=3032197 RepID=UPI002554E3F9|nr:LuxR C-terminal-related transcriptional regulator [Kineosporia sp. NBRC 101677]